jgi:ssDNA-binding Zn-finger/Zn-ribbon topoisomerase 1
MQETALNIIQHRLKAAARSVRLAFTGDPIKWLEENVRFPHSSRSTHFDRETAPWWNDVILDFVDPTCRQTFVQACTGAGKSTALEALICWSVAQQPGPLLSITQTDATSAEWMQTRLKPVLYACDPLRELLPSNRHHIKKDGVYFPHMPLMLGGANTSNAQEKSVQVLLLDECWQYSDLITQFKKRLHDRWNGYALLASQSFEEPHQLTEEWRAGEEFVWCHSCPNCNEWVKPDWVNIKYDECKNAQGEWNWGELVKSVRHECPHCGHLTADSMAARRSLTLRSKWISQENDHVEGFRSRRVAAQSVYWIKWSDLVIQWCQASDARHLGVLQPTKDFRMQRLAEPWKEEEDLPVLELEAAQYFQNEWQDGRPMPDEAARIMTVDVQQDHYWVIVRVWLNNGHSKLLWAGKVLTVDELRELQLRLKIHDKRTLVDAGNSFHGKVYDLCAKHNWVALIGRAEDHFTVRGKDGKPIKRYYSAPDRVVAPTTRDAKGKRIFVTFFYWSSDPIKDVLANLRNAGSPIWEFPQDAPPEYIRHLNSERKRATVDKRTKKTRLRWTATGRPNHMWDAEAMNVLTAQMLGILPDMVSAIPEVDESPEAE